MEWSGSLSRSPGKGASPHAGTGSSARRRRRFAGMDSSGRPSSLDACTIEGNDAAACATRREATSTSLEPKMKNEESKIKNPQINNECMEKILLQLVGAVMKVGNLLKCILAVLVFFGFAILAKNW
ncbi:Phosphatidylinositol-4-phosphate 5-kinase 2 [Hordeum vulgare]|nr:Phosphatidylinositol-4-phosphate 5-kinase 2 [Hordeum vulgare]